MKKRYHVLVKIETECSECSGKKYEYRPLQTSNGKIYEFSLKEALKYIETYSFMIPSYRIGREEPFKLEVIL